MCVCVSLSIRSYVGAYVNKCCHEGNFGLQRSGHEDNLRPDCDATCLQFGVQVSELKLGRFGWTQCPCLWMFIKMYHCIRILSRLSFDAEKLCLVWHLMVQRACKARNMHETSQKTRLCILWSQTYHLIFKD